MQTIAEDVIVLDDASHDRLRLAVWRGLSQYGEAELLDCLEDQDPILRTVAARQLHIRGTRAAFEHARALLDHPRFDRREIGIFVLGQLGTPGCPYAAETFRELPRLLADNYAEVRSAAAGAIGSLATLGHQPPRPVVNALLPLVEDLDADVRASVAFALGMVDDPAAEALLGALDDDPDQDVRDMAETALDWVVERRQQTGAVKQARTSHG